MAEKHAAKQPPKNDTPPQENVPAMFSQPEDDHFEDDIPGEEEYETEMAGADYQPDIF